MLHLITSFPKPLSGAAAFLGITLVGTIDVFTGFEVSLSVFYAIFVIAAVWSLGRVAGGCAAFYAVSLWTAADHFSGHPFASDWILLWNATVRFSFFLLVVVGAVHTKRHLESVEARSEALEQVLPICTCCKKIADEHGAWVDVETYLGEHLSSSPTMKLCPDCSRKVYIDKVSPADVAAPHVHSESR